MCWTNCPVLFVSILQGFFHICERYQKAWMKVQSDKIFFSHLSLLINRRLNWYLLIIYWYYLNYLLGLANNWKRIPMHLSIYFLKTIWISYDFVNSYPIMIRFQFIIFMKYCKIFQNNKTKLLQCMAIVKSPISYTIIYSKWNYS